MTLVTILSLRSVLDGDLLRQLNSRIGSDTAIGEVCEELTARKGRTSVPRAEHNTVYRREWSVGTDVDVRCRQVRTSLTFSEETTSDSSIVGGLKTIAAKCFSFSQNAVREGESIG
jgi:hypothetical protein